MKATKEQWDKAVTIYENEGASAVFVYAERIGVYSYSYCRDCEEHTPDCHDDSCLVCGLLKPPARRPQLILRDCSSDGKTLTSRGSFIPVGVVDKRTKYDG